MNIEFVNPFLVSIINVLATMAKTEAIPDKPFLKTEKSAKGDVTGIIGLTGDKKAKGSLAITFTEPAIVHIVSKMLGEDLQKIDLSVADCVGEITNMVTGGAKKILSEKGYKFDMAIPSVIIGRNHAIVHSTKGQVICIPFKITAGSFFIEVCFEE
jgi:chemotaxis protein CheX